MLKDGGFSTDQIIRYTGLSSDEINDLSAELSKIDVTAPSNASKKSYQKVIKDLCLMDDGYMSRFFAENIEGTELVINTVLDDKQLKVKDVRTQYSIASLRGRKVVLDVLATDANGKKYNIEVQNEASGAVPKRARYNSSMVDYSASKQGEGYDTLVETYVIFITKTDVLGGQLPLYHIDRIVKETGEYFGDESHIIYVNSKILHQQPSGVVDAGFCLQRPGENAL